MTALSPPEAVAASVCWLARWRAGAPVTTLRAMSERIDEFWHPKRCRYCDVPTAELIALLDQPRPVHADREFRDLPKTARLARIREAQEPPWWEDFTGPPAEAPLTGEKAAS